MKSGSRLAFAAVFMIGVVDAGCYGLAAQDTTGLDTGRRLIDAAVCDLAQVPSDAGAPWVARARADLRPARAEVQGILRRNGVDGGQDQPAPCAPGVLP